MVFRKYNTGNLFSSWFVWANILFGELLWNVFKKQPETQNL
tara:strand:+ start:32315 stop:32437 length:123 start_codon:yes stop_codon:yes gene_type:complete